MVDLRQELGPLKLIGVQETEDKVGQGSYGKVIVVYYKGFKCAGKVLHQELTQNAESEEEVKLAERFAKECIQMSKARHPNIVLFLGVYFQQDCKFPILVMEYLPMCLDECLSKYRNLPPYVKNNILLDVAHGLQYLHGMNTIHRDLTAKNVLIGDNLRAKIADLGVSKIISASIADHFPVLTEIPGNANYMPPEAFAKSSAEGVKYGASLDIFSYGVLVINTVTHKWPTPKSTVHLMKEIDRRRGDLDLMGKNHPLRSLAEQCLSDKPDQRPPIVNIVSELEKVITDNPAPFRNTMELLQDYCRCSEESTRLQAQVRESEEKKQLFERRASQLGDEHEASARQISVQENEIQNMQRLLKTKEQEVSIKEILLSQKEERIQALNMRIAALSQECSGQVNLFDPTVSIKCDTLAELPQKRKHAQAVVLNGKIYVGSGYCESDELAHEIAVLCLQTNQWEQLPQSETRWFAMAVYENELVLISGKYRDGKGCTRVAKLKEENRNFAWTWPEDIMEMRAARMGASATSIASHLLVAGGWDKTRSRVNTVEVYDKHKRQWFKAQPLPKMAAECKTALIDNDTWFFMGGANQQKAVFYVSVQEIIKQAVPMIIERPTQEAIEHDENLAEDSEGDMLKQVSTGDTGPLWKTLPDAPHEFCCAAVLGGSLVSIGGTGLLWNHKAIHAYISHTNSWLKIGEIPAEGCRAVAVSLDCGSVIVLGGVDSKKRLVSTVTKCTLT